MILGLLFHVRNVFNKFYPLVYFTPFGDLPLFIPDQTESSPNLVSSLPRVTKVVQNPIPIIIVSILY